MQPKPLREELLQATVQAPTFITGHDIAVLCRVSDSTVSRWSRFGTGGFPKPTVHEGKMHLYLTADYVQWVATKAAQRGDVPMPVDKRTLKRRRYA
jgi:hypothetical protein